MRDDAREHCGDAIVVHKVGAHHQVDGGVDAGLVADELGGASRFEFDLPGITAVQLQLPAVASPASAASPSVSMGGDIMPKSDPSAAGMRKPLRVRKSARQQRLEASNSNANAAAAAAAAASSSMRLVLSHEGAPRPQIPPMPPI